MSKKLTQEEYIKRVKNIYGEIYDYKNTLFTDLKDEICVYCNKCKSFFKISAHKHLYNHQGCKNCIKQKKLINQRSNTKEFVEKAKQRHGDLYDYSLVDYQDAKKVVSIICNKCHKVFYQTPNNHLRGQGCSYCNGNHKKDLNYFIERAKSVHGDRYDYSEVEYKNNRTPVKIKCNKCGKYFYQDLGNHISQKQGCPYCYASGGENIIVNFLDEHKIIYETQKKFKDCKDKTYLRFDFYLPDFEMCIEYQGKQHYEEGFYFYTCLIKNKIKAKEAFEIVKYHDEIKRNYCYNHNINLLEIRYDEDINTVLSKNLCID